MAKKKNPVFDTDVGANNAIVDSVIVPKAEPTVINLNEDGIEVTTKVTDEIERLTKENSDLADKIASYLEAIDTEKTKQKPLQDEIDRLTLRISELTFENARLKSELAKASKPIVQPEQPGLPVPVQAQRAPLQTTENLPVSKPIKYPYYVMNGYSGWN